MLAVILPSRALVQSRTVEDVIRELEGIDFKLFMAHGRPIPDCFNEPLEEALTTTDADHLLFIEDDMQLPPGIVQELFKAGSDIATADYPVRETQHVANFLDDRLAWAGLGCTLVKRQVFEKLGKPYFRVDTAYQVQDDTLIAGPAQANYGIFDVDFYQRAREFDIKLIDMTAGQYFLKKPELPKYNNKSALEYEVETWRL